MVRQDNKGSIADKINELSDGQKLIFAYLTCEKLQPNYLYFEENNGWGDIETITNSLHIIKNYILRNTVPSINRIKELIEEIDSATPDTSDFSNITASFALDCCTSIYNCLNYLIDRNPAFIIEISGFALDTVDMFIQEKNDINPSNSEIEDIIISDEFMVMQKKRQSDLVYNLSGLGEVSITQAVLNALQTSQPIIDFSLLRVEF